MSKRNHPPTAFSKLHILYYAVRFNRPCFGVAPFHQFQPCWHWGWFWLVLNISFVRLLNNSYLLSACIAKQILGKTFIGPNKDVVAEYYSCVTGASLLEASATLATHENGPTNVCGLECPTQCFNGSGGPNPNDCQVIADALMYDNQNIGWCK